MLEKETRWLDNYVIWTYLDKKNTRSRWSAYKYAIGEALKMTFWCVRNCNLDETVFMFVFYDSDYKQIIVIIIIVI